MLPSEISEIQTLNPNGKKIALWDITSCEMGD